MLSDGFALIYANCTEYFRVAGRTQQRLLFGRDLLGTFGTLATGVVALAHASKDATAIAALVTATGYSVMDDIAKDFLFSADNIDSVRDITLRAIQANQASVFFHNSVFNYNTVVLYLEDNQDYCTLRRIAALVKDAAKNAKVGEAPKQSGVALPGSVVKVYYDDDKSDTETFLIATRQEGVSDGKLEVYSPKSPLGEALIDAKVGETRTYTVPNGNTVKVTLVSAEPYHS